jgi:hypothetical protein
MRKIAYLYVFDTLADWEPGYAIAELHSGRYFNDLAYLKASCPTYTGASCYLHQPSVCDGDLITASGLAALDFAYTILKRLDVFLPATLDAWYKLYQTYETPYFFALMNSLPPTA